jgi:hypothetical protein
VTPELLQTLTAAKGLPMPVEDHQTVDPVVQLMRKERRIREMLNRLEGREDPEAQAARAKLLCHTQTAHGKQTRSSKSPEWTAAECAQACQGLDNRYFYALRWVNALDDSVFFNLGSALWWWALERREIESWPRRVTSADGESLEYLRPLVDMWLIEARVPWRFVRGPADPDTRPIIVNVTQLLWRRRLSPIYEAIADEYRRWERIGHNHMQRWIGREDIA